MKKITIFILLVVILTSCSMIYVDNSWYELNCMPEGIDKYSENTKIYNWCVKNIQYKFYANGFHPAQLTLDQRIGNCANNTLLTLALIYKLKEIKGKLIFCQLWDYSLHYTPEVEGYRFEGNRIRQIYEIVEFDNIAKYIHDRQGL